MKVKELEKGKIIIEDYTSLDFYSPADKIRECTPLKNPLLIKEFKKDVDVLEPVNDGNEFLVKFIGQINRTLTDHYTNFNIKNRYYGDIFPDFRETVYPYFKEAYDKKGKSTLKYFFYKRGVLKFIVDSTIIYENGEIWILYSNVNPSKDTADFDFDYFDEDHIIEKYIKSINNQESVVILYDAKKDTYSCPDEIYSLFECEKTPGDDIKKILTDSMFENDVKYMNSQIEKLAWNDSQFTFNFKIITPKNQVKTLRCFLFGIFDDDRELSQIFYFLKDMTDYDLSTSNLKELNDNIHAIQTLSRAAIYYLNLHGEYVWTSNIREIIESPTFDPKTDYNIIRDLVIDEDRYIIEDAFKSLNRDNPLQNFKVRIKTLKGNVKLLNLIIKRVYDGSDEIISSSMQVFDITKGTVENNFIRLINAFNAVAPNLKIAVIYESSKGKFKPSNLIFELLGIDDEKWYPDGRKTFYSNLIDAAELKTSMDKLLNHEIDEFDLLLKYRYRGNADDIRFLKIFMYRDENKDISGYIEDITETKRIENNLKKLNEDKVILLKEVHHRVKNNLQVLSSLLNLEERFYRNQPEEILKSTKKRLNSIALIHEMTYGSMNMETVNLKEYFDVFDRDMFNIYSNDHLIIDNEVDENSNLPLRKVTPLVLIITELISNSIKYAFDYENQEVVNKITKKISFEDDKCVLVYKDNGKGFPEGFDINDSDGLGWTIINSFVNQLDGKMEQIESEGMGLRFEFPINGD